MEIFLHSASCPQECEKYITKQQNWPQNVGFGSMVFQRLVCWTFQKFLWWKGVSNSLMIKIMYYVMGFRVTWIHKSSFAMTSYGQLNKHSTPLITFPLSFLSVSFHSQVVTAMSAVCLRLLLLLPLVCCVPSPSRPPSRLCKRCCDHMEPPAATAQYQIPEVRTVINMTILKGSRDWINFCLLLSLKLAGASCLFGTSSVFRFQFVFWFLQDVTWEVSFGHLFVCICVTITQLQATFPESDHIFCFSRWLCVWQGYYLTRRVIM